MDDVDVVLRRAFGALYCIYGIKGFAEAVRLRARGSLSPQALLEGFSGALLLVAGVGAALTPHLSIAVCVMATLAIGILLLSPRNDARATQTVDLSLLVGVLLYLATA